MTAISPAAELVRTMRESLAASGLVRRELDGSVYWSGGQAPSPVLVLLHGTNDQAGTWSRVVPMLITLAGNSFGAWIALLYALAHPAQVKRLVLEAGGGLARPLGVHRTGSRNRDDDPARGARTEFRAAGLGDRCASCARY